MVKSHDKTRKIRVIMLSGNDSVFDKVRGKLCGCDDYITKPFESAGLVKIFVSQLPVSEFKAWTCLTHHPSLKEFNTRNETRSRFHVDKALAGGSTARNRFRSTGGDAPFFRQGCQVELLKKACRDGPFGVPENK